MKLKPWQHVVEWPDEEVILDMKFLIVNAERRRDGLYQIPGYIIHGPVSDLSVDGYRATKLSTDGRILVTEDHDGGDEQP